MELGDHNSIAKRIIEGTLTFDSVEDFETTLAIFPKNPGVHRAYGDMLAGLKSTDGAVTAYQKACRLYIDQGMMLQAMVAKILEWRLARPSREEARRFHGDLSGIATEDSPLKAFITAMTYAEMIAFMMKVVRVRLPAQKQVKTYGDLEDSLYFVVSGLLKETYRSTPGQDGRKTAAQTVDLTENDVFGDIFPLEETRQSDTAVETMRPSEVVKISTQHLNALCKDFPNMETLIKTLSEESQQARHHPTTSTIRKATRHQLPTKASLKVFSKGGKATPLVLDGFTEDISLGGTCFVLGDAYRVGPPAELVGEKVKLQVSLPKAGGDLTILGTIVWGKEVPGEDGTGIALGLQFHEMDDPSKTKLQEYCSGSDGEQNLILSLWESYIKP